MSSRIVRKGKYMERLSSILDQYSRFIIVTADNVGSSHMQKIRTSLRGKAELVMGKNTLMRKTLRAKAAENPDIQILLPHIKNNVGLLCIPDDGDIADVREAVLDLTVPCLAKAGAIAPCDVTIPAGPTSLPPTKTNYLQVLNIASKVNRGAVEILQDVELLKKGDKVDTSRAGLLQMLDMKPFYYGLVTLQVYDQGALYSADFLDVTEEDVAATVTSVVQNIAAISLAVHYASMAAFPHVVINGYKNVLALALATEYSYEHADKVRDAIENPTFVAAAPAAEEAAPAEAAPAEESSDSDDGGMFGLFD